MTLHPGALRNQGFGGQHQHVHSSSPEARPSGPFSLVRALTLALANKVSAKRLDGLDRVASGSSHFDSFAVEEF